MFEHQKAITSKNDKQKTNCEKEKKTCEKRKIKQERR